MSGDQAQGTEAGDAMKRLIGDSLRSKSPDAQTREAKIAVRVLNRMTGLGQPESVKIAA